MVVQVPDQLHVELAEHLRVLEGGRGQGLDEVAQVGPHGFEGGDDTLFALQPTSSMTRSAC